MDQVTGKQRFIVKSCITMDGGGWQRAYNHRITGTQHMFNIHSSVTKDIIYQKTDQVCCPSCSKKKSEHLGKTGKKAVNLSCGEFDFQHTGKCCRNSCNGPATAEGFVA
jgi:hypothetical protein